MSENSDAACRRLVLEFGRLVDADETAAIAALFTPDAVYRRGDVVATGRREIGSSITPAPAGTRRLHLYSNLIVTAESESAATGTCYYQAYRFDGAGQPAGLTPTVIGRIVDRFVRLDGHWLIASREQTRIARSGGGA